MTFAWAVLAVRGIGLLILGNHVMTAQSISSSVQGTVKDTSGAVVPAAEVILMNIDTGTRLVTHIDSTGSYAFPSIGLGSYSLSISKHGFETYNLSHFNIVVGDPSVASEQAQLMAELLMWTIRSEDTLPTNAYKTKWPGKHNWYAPYRHGNVPEILFHSVLLLS